MSLQAGEIPDSNPTMTVSSAAFNSTVMHSCSCQLFLSPCSSYHNSVLSSQVEFKISQLAISGLKVNRLDMYGEVS